MSNSDHSLDKGAVDVYHNEKVAVPYADSNEAQLEYSPQEQSRIMKRLDRRIVAITGLIYCISLMDRTNLSAAAIAGMTKELKIVQGDGYSIITLVFFVSYIIFQPFGTIACRKFGPRTFLSLITLFWGSVMIGMGFIKQWPIMAGMRVLLGVFEAAYFPAAVYLLSTWYTRYEMGKRYAVFYTVGCVASACSGILAFGLMQMHGLSNLQGWSWIFIMEGVITCIIAIVAYIFLVPFPDAGADRAWGFLKKPEVDFIIRKVDADRGDVQLEAFTMGRFLRGGLDLKVWGFALIFCFTTTVSYALAYFLPIILRDGMGFDVGAAQCLVAPPYALAGIWMFACGWFGDKYHIRGPIIVVNAVLMIVGLALMGFISNVGGRYFGVFLACAGANCSVPAVLTYQANNIRGQWKRAFCSATLVGFGGIGGIAGSLVFRSQDNPTYRPGLYACMAAAALSIVVVGLLSVHFKAANAKAARGEKNIEGADSDFRYTY